MLLDWEHPYLFNSAELDEKYPVSKLPEHMRRRACIDPNNVQVLCRRCNKAKGAKLPRQEAEEALMRSRGESVAQDEESETTGW